MGKRTNLGVGKSTRRVPLLFVISPLGCIATGRVSVDCGFIPLTMGNPTLPVRGGYIPILQPWHKTVAETLWCILAGEPPILPATNIKIAHQDMVFYSRFLVEIAFELW